MKLYTAKQVAELVNLQPKHIWREVRRRGIEPSKANNMNVLTQDQLDLYLERRKSGYFVPGTYKAKAKPRKKQRQEVEGVTMKTSAGQAYTYIPAPWDVPEAWQWGK